MILRPTDSNGHSVASILLNEDGSYEILADDSSGNFATMMQSVDQMTVTSAVERRGIAMHSSLYQILRGIPELSLVVEDPLPFLRAPRRAVV